MYCCNYRFFTLEAAWKCKIYVAYVQLRMVHLSCRVSHIDIWKAATQYSIYIQVLYTRYDTLPHYNNTPPLYVYEQSTLCLSHAYIETRAEGVRCYTYTSIYASKVDDSTSGFLRKMRISREQTQYIVYASSRRGRSTEYPNKQPSVHFTTILF